MAKLVRGVGTAHSPIVSEPAQYWTEHGKFEESRPGPVRVAYGGGEWDELVKQRGERLSKEITADAIQQKWDRTQKAVAEVAEILKETNPDALVIVGDDQDDVFLHEYTMPALCIYRGESMVNPPRDTAGRPEWMRSAMWGQYPEDVAETYPCEPELATHIVASLVQQEFDVTHVTNPPEGRAVGHAFTFLERRLLAGNGHRIPIVPVMLNTYYPPNQPPAARCFKLGQALRRAIESWDADKRVVIAASGGLTHPILDEQLDRDVLDAMQRKDAKALTGMTEDIFKLGTSEIKNWITVAGAMQDTSFNMRVIDYIPAFRSLAGTGCGLAFADWS
jgi:hypothetical protein